MAKEKGKEKEVAYLIKGNARLIAVVKATYKRKSLTVYETKFKDWVLVMTDPKDVLPVDILQRVIIEKYPLSKSWEILKYPELELEEEKVKEGDFVEIVEGEYRGLRGKIKSINKMNKAKLVVLIFGRPAVIDVPVSHLKKAI